MMGREMLPVPAVPAGCVCGVGGLEQHVLKYATLASSRVCRPLSFMTFQVARPPGLVCSAQSSSDPSCRPCNPDRL